MAGYYFSKRLQQFFAILLFMNNSKVSPMETEWETLESLPKNASTLRSYDFIILPLIRLHLCFKILRNPPALHKCVKLLHICNNI